MSKTILAKNIEFDNGKHNVNRNLFIEGASGSGKTRYIIKPNIMNCNESFIVTDPKGDLYNDTKQLLLDKGYEIKVLNLYNVGKSSHYNPLALIKDSQDIKKVAKMLVKPDRQNEYWSNSAINLLEALLYFVWETKGSYRGHTYDFNLKTIGKLAKNIEIGKDYESPFSCTTFTNTILKNYSSDHPDSNTAAAYCSFATIVQSTQTASCVIHTLTSNLSVFDNTELLSKLSTNDFNFEELKTKKQAYFVIVNDTDTSLYPLIALFYQQAINVLFEYSDLHKTKGEHVRLIFDDAFTSVKIENLDALISNCRSRNVSFTLVAQSRSQIESLYNKAYSDTVIANCSSYVFLGTNDFYTADYHARRTDKKVKDIMSMDLNKCIVYVQGKTPQFAEKYNIRDHKNYRYLTNEKER